MYDNRNQEGPSPKNLHVYKSELAADKIQCFTSCLLCFVPSLEDVSALQFMQWCPIATIRMCNESTHSEQMHYVKSCKPFSPKIFNKRSHFVLDETCMLRGNFSTLDVCRSQANTQCVHTFECLDSISKTIINHFYGG